MISIYSIISEEWITHFTFDSNVLALFRASFSLTKQYQITVLLSNNTLKVIKQDKDNQAKDGDQEGWIEDDSYDLSLPEGKVKDFAFDQQNQQFVLLLITNGDDISLIALSNNKIFNITDQIEKFGKKEQKNNIFFLFTGTSQSKFILQFGKNINIYDINLRVKKVRFPKQNSLQTLDDIIKEEDEADHVEEEGEEASSDEEKLKQSIVKEFEVAITINKTFKVKEIERNLLFGLIYY